MAKFKTRLCALVVALAICGANPCLAAEPFPAATPGSQGLSSQSLAKLLEVVRGFAGKGDIVGGELLVIKNRRTVLHETVGLGDRESQNPLKRDTIYCIRSMTKPVMGAAVQILIEEGRLSLDDTAAKFLPSFDNDKSRGITVRQLLTHTGGLPLSSILGTNFQALGSLRDVADRSGTNGPTIPPGSRFRYSDDGAETLGAIVAVVTGKPAEAFIATRILEPLGMRDTFPLVPAAGNTLDRFTPAYAGRRGNWVRFWSPQDKPIFPYFLASQGMYSTAKDYARFLAMYLDQGRVGDTAVLSRAAVARTLTPAIATGAPTGFPKLATYYGQMMIHYVDAPRKRVAFGHSGSDGTWAWAWPEHDLMVLYFTQSRGNTTGVELEGAIDSLLLGGTEAEPIAQELTDEASAPYLGIYASASQQRPWIVVRDRNRLAIELPSQGSVELKKEQERNVWSFVTAPGNSVKFHREGSGLATSFDLRRGNNITTLQRMTLDQSALGLNELFARRGQQREEKLRALGAIRMSGTIERSTSQDKGTFEQLFAGDDHYRLKINLGGAETQQAVAGDRAWIRLLASSPVQELSAAKATSARLDGWLLASGDWRREFDQSRVLKRAEVGDQLAVIIVHAAPKEGRQRLVYLDAVTGSTLGYDQVHEIAGLGMIGAEVRFSDYRDVGGVQIPFKVTTKYSKPALGTLTFQVEKIETGLKFDKDAFVIN